MDPHLQSLLTTMNYLVKDLANRQSRPALMYPIGAGAGTTESILKEIEELKEEIAKYSQKLS